jgi:hypothetical protein
MRGTAARTSGRCHARAERVALAKAQAPGSVARLRALLKPLVARAFLAQVCRLARVAGCPCLRQLVCAVREQCVQALSALRHLALAHARLGRRSFRRGARPCAVQAGRAARQRASNVRSTHPHPRKARHACMGACMHAWAHQHPRKARHRWPGVQPRAARTPRQSAHTPRAPGTACGTHLTPRLHACGGRLHTRRCGQLHRAPAC